MKLKSLSKIPPNNGDILVGRAFFALQEKQLRFVIIEKNDNCFIYINNFGALFDDLEEPESESQWRIKPEECQHYLARPILELGDPVYHRGRPAQIRECREGDWHVKLNYTDELGGEFYGNIVWMDLSPALDLLDLTTAWPSLS